MSLKGKKTIGAPFANEAEIVRVVYDFAEDGGTVGDYDVVEAESNCVVKLKYAAVKAAVTSAGALVADLGKGDGGAEFWSDQGKAALALDAIVCADADAGVKLSSGEKIVLGIEGGAVSAGKVEFVFEVMKY